MSFTQNTFAPIGGQTTSAASMFSYRSDDSFSEVSAAGYFLSKSSTLEAGDHIMATLGDGPFVFVYVAEDQPLLLLSPSDPSLINIERLLDAESVALSQEPIGLGASNAVQIEFGPPVNTPLDPVNIDASGALFVNESGTYRIKAALQFGRTGGAGTSELLFRVLANGVQSGRSVHTSVQNSNITSYFENDTWIFLPAGTILTFEVMRDASGNDSGGIYSFTPSAEAGSWNFSPSSAIRVDRWSV